MATKAEAARVEAQRASTAKKKTTKPARAEPAPTKAKTHLEKKVSRKLETHEEGKRPSRKSTRSGENHVKGDAVLTRTAKAKVASPEARAAKARGQAKRVGGKGR